MRQNARILVVEDEAIVALRIQNNLEKMGHSVIGICGTGEDAMQECKEKHPDLVLMDIKLRGPMDGIETAEILSNNLDLPIIFLTAHSEEVTIERAKGASPYGYLLKPILEKELRIAIQMTLHNHEKDLKIKEMQLENEKLISELQEALANIKTLQGLLPTCASCKKIRNDDGEWEEIEHYIQNRSEAKFSHGICPDCVKKLYPDFHKKMAKKELKDG